MDKKDRKFDDDRLKDFIRKPYREFLKIDGPAQAAAISKFYLSSLGADHGDFEQATGIRLLDHMGTYMESGAALGPVGPVLPGPIAPILAFRLSGRGNYQTTYLKLPGLYHESLSLAWIKTSIWEEAIGDASYFEEEFLMGKELPRGKTKETK